MAMVAEWEEIMVDLTVIILTKNEEKNLRKCVESFRGAAKRFVVVDSFSTDGTKALAGQLNEELQKQGASLDFYENPWKDYATQFNWGIENTDISTEWTMRMDADEELLPVMPYYSDRSRWVRAQAAAHPDPGKYASLL